MSQCKSITKNGKRCTRHALPQRRYCWQHESITAKVFSLSALVAIVLTIIGLLADLRGLGVPIPSFDDDLPITGTPSFSPSNMNLSDFTTREKQMDDFATQQAQANVMLAELATGVASGQVDTMQATVIFEQLQGTAIALEQTVIAFQKASSNNIANALPSKTPTPPDPFSLTAAAQDPTLIALQDINIRNGPGKEYGVVGIMYKNQRVKLLASSWSYYWKIECPNYAYARECWVTGGDEYTRETNVVVLPVLSDTFDKTNLWDFEILRNEKDGQDETIHFTIAHHFDLPYLGTICLEPELLYKNQKVFIPGNSIFEKQCFDGYVGVTEMEITLSVPENENIITDQVKIIMSMQDNEKFVYSKTFDYYKVWGSSQE